MNWLKSISTKILKQKKTFARYFYYLQWCNQTKNLRKDFPKYRVLSFEETIQQIISQKKSLSRFGDGEFRLCFPEKNIGFQKGDVTLVNKLNEVLQSNLENHLTAIPESLYSVKNLVITSKYWWKKYINEMGKEIVKILPKNKVYGNAFISRFYLIYDNKKNISEKVEHLKKIWDNQEILIIEGKFSRLGVGNDLFSNSKKISRILCPEKNAFDKYDEILENAKVLGENKLILIALGPTATVMAYDLAKLGFWAIDIGHIDLEYMWFLQKATHKIPVKSRLVNETETQLSIEIPTELKEDYQNSILKIIN